MSHRLPLYRPSALVDGVASAIKADTGEAMAGCPWRSFSDPFVGEVIHAYGLFETGQVSLLLGQDPPHCVIEGLIYYDRVIKRIRGHDEDRRERDRQMKNTVKAVTARG